MTTNRSAREDGPYVLRSVLDNMPLAEDGTPGDVAINCVEYFGAYSGSIELSMEIANHNFQTGTFTSAHQPPRSFILYAFRPILQTRTLVQSSSPHHEYLLPLYRMVKGNSMAYSRFSCFPKYPKLASYATVQLRSIACPSSHQRSELPKSKTATG